MNQEKFKKVVWDYYRENKRDDMPWRKTTNPYLIMVSEIMLQQTQVNRVIEKYNEFTTLFPTISDLANAELASVLKVWQGLGYNRRAKFLKQAAEMIESEFNGVFPEDIDSLVKLPGIGKNTASAILAYAFNIGTPYVETNIRTVFIHHFFPDHEEVTDPELLDLVSKTMDKNNSREWFWAIMDYGTHLKKTVGNNISKSKHYVKQSTFKGSRRQKRGAIIRYLTNNEVGSIKHFVKETGAEKDLIKEIVSDLEKEEMIERVGESFVLKS